MRFKVGEEVRIGRALGEQNGLRKGEYYNGGDLKNVPLGSKGKIIQVESQQRILINLPRVGNWYVHADEILEDPEAEKRRKESLKGVDNLVENQLLDNSKDVEGAGHEERKIHKECESKYKIIRKLVDAFKRMIYSVEVDYSADGPRGFEITKFNPKFNAREEFAVWVRNEFPEIRSTTRIEDYEKLSKFYDEVREAALQACEHGVNTTNSCIKSGFHTYLDYFKRKDTKKFCGNLNGLVDLIEMVSTNLKDGAWHYGTALVRGAR